MLIVWIESYSTQLEIHYLNKLLLKGNKSIKIDFWEQIQHNAPYSDSTLVKYWCFEEIQPFHTASSYCFWKGASPLLYFASTKAKNSSRNNFLCYCVENSVLDKCVFSYWTNNKKFCERNKYLVFYSLVKLAIIDLFPFKRNRFDLTRNINN